MAEHSTFIKLDRNMMKWRWYQDAVTKSVFIHLLFRANIKPSDFQDVHVERGQLITSLSHLAAETGLSIQQTRTALEHLKSTNEITQSTNNRYTLITLTNYDAYQGKPTSKSTSNQHAINTQSNKQSTTIKEYKNIDANASIKERKKGAPAPVPADADCSPRDWEIEHKVPDRFIGRFPNFEMWEEWRLNH